MIIYVLIPVFNRLLHTKNVINCLRAQINVSIQIIVIDDGSTDGTSEFLINQSDIWYLKGDGNLWWAGAMQLGLKRIHDVLCCDDFIVFINNDTVFDDNFIQNLVEASIANGRSAVGSIVRNGYEPYELIDVGPKANIQEMAVWDILRDMSFSDVKNLKVFYEVDFLPGRGVIYPSKVLDCAGYMRPLLLPHYYADYEFSYRAKKNGIPLLVCSTAVTFSMEVYGNKSNIVNSWVRLFGKGSSQNIFHKALFYSLVGTPIQRFTAIPRIIWGYIYRQLNIPLVIRALRKVAYLIKITIKKIFILFSSFSSMAARSKLLVAIERRGKKRIEAFHVYALYQLINLDNKLVYAVGDFIPLHLPYFNKFNTDVHFIENENLSNIDSSANCFFCAWSSFDMNSFESYLFRMLDLLDENGVLYFILYNETNDFKLDIINAHAHAHRGKYKTIIKKLTSNIVLNCSDKEMIPTDYFTKSISSNNCYSISIAIQKENNL